MSYLEDRQDRVLIRLYWETKVLEYAYKCADVETETKKERRERGIRETGEVIRKIEKTLGDSTQKTWEGVQLLRASLALAREGLRLVVGNIDVALAVAEEELKNNYWDVALMV